MKNNSGWLQGKKKEKGGEITVEVGSSKTAAIVTGGCFIYILDSSNSSSF